MTKATAAIFSTENIGDGSDPHSNEQMARLIHRSRRLVGCRARDLQAGVVIADWLSISRMVCALGDRNPLYLDPNYGARSWWSSMLAPPAFLLSIIVPRSAGAMDASPCSALDRLRRLDLVWDDHIRLGESVTASAYISRVEKISAGSGLEGMQIETRASYQAGGRRVASACGEVIVQPLKLAEKVIVDRAIHEYSDEEIARIVAELEAEPAPRGARPRFFEDVSPGDQLSPVTRGPLTWSEFQSWMVAEGRPAPAGNLRYHALRDRPGEVLPEDASGWRGFGRAEARYDLKHSAAVGLPLPTVKGSMLAGLASQLITNWMGDVGFLRTLSCRLDQPAFYGDTLRLTGTVADVFEQQHGGHDRAAIAIDVLAVNQLGERVLWGHAIVLLPRRGRPIELPVTEGIV